MIHTHVCCPSKPRKHPSCGTKFDENYKTTKPCSGWCLLLQEEQHAMVMLPPIPFVCIWTRSDKPGNNQNTLGSCSSKHQSTQAVELDLVRSAKAPCHPQMVLCCYMTNHGPWMCCQAFHIFCGCTSKV